MRIKAFFKLCLSMLIVYVTLGDMFLPQPYRNNSQQVRHHINQFLIALFPEKEFTNFKRTASTIKKLEEEKFNSSY